MTNLIDKIHRIASLTDRLRCHIRRTHPPPTRIHNETETIGRCAARYLMDAIDGHPHHGVDYVPCRLIQRESTLPLD
ncbi:substrate-binding domain-containing protein [Bifidobacterium longum]|uniref:substrate-binding domain-containing protein n=1 Tax=Bifidobacterium longum TaxID=216816 RepID=UPI00351CD29A